MHKPWHELGVQFPEHQSDPSCRWILAIPLIDELDDFEVLVQIDEKEGVDNLCDTEYE